MKLRVFNLSPSFIASAVGFLLAGCGTYSSSPGADLPATQIAVLKLRMEGLWFNPLNVTAVDENPVSIKWGNDSIKVLPGPHTFTFAMGGPNLASSNTITTHMLMEAGKTYRAEMGIFWLDKHSGRWWVEMGEDGMAPKRSSSTEFALSKPHRRFPRMAPVAWPNYYEELHGDQIVRVVNSNDFRVLVGLRPSSNRGKIGQANRKTQSDTMRIDSK